MARSEDSAIYGRPVRRILLLLLIIFLSALVLLWRIDNPRAEALRASVVDRVVPKLEWTLVPVTRIARMIEDFQGYARVYEQNQELRRELQRMKQWEEAAIQLGQENARLLDLNQVVLSPDLTFITGVVLTDAGSPFRRSILINIGDEVGVQDGWAAMDGLGLVGRIAGVGRKTARIILVTDPTSQIPVTIEPSGTRAVMAGDITTAPVLDFLESTAQLRPGDRVVTSGDAGVFPADLLIGNLVQDSNRRWRVNLAAQMDRLEFLRVLRTQPLEEIPDARAIVSSTFEQGP